MRKRPRYLWRFHDIIFYVFLVFFLKLTEYYTYHTYKRIQLNIEISKENTSVFLTAVPAPFFVFHHYVLPSETDDGPPFPCFGL